SSVADAPRRRPPPPCNCTHHTPLTGADKAPLLSSTVIDRTGPSAGLSRDAAVPARHPVFPRGRSLLRSPSTDSLAFERLQGRLQRRGAGAAHLAAEWPAHFVAFDLLRLAGTTTTAWPYRQRRAAFEDLYTEHKPTTPRELCPSTTVADTVSEWLSWTAVGLEGISWTGFVAAR
ncbi:hypothetical protein ABZ612_37140, partial [Streptomyces avermitilis]